MLNHVDNLGSTLQHKTMSAAEGQTSIRMTVETLDQPGYQSFQSMKTILIKACVQENLESQLNDACKNYQSDLDKDLLQAQLLTLGVSYSQAEQAEQEEPKNRMSVFNIREYLLRVLSVH